MTALQTLILQLMTKLPLDERRALVEHFYDVNLFGDSILDRLSPAQRARFDESIAQADRGNVIPSDTVFSEIAQTFGFSRS